MLKISGKQEESSEEKDKEFVRRERRYGAFSRTMALPEGVDPKKIKATTTDGVLEINVPLPKEPAAEPVSITPTAGGWRSPVRAPSTRRHGRRPPRRPAINDAGLLTPAETALLSDQYELAMAASYLRQGMNEPGGVPAVRAAPPPRRDWLLGAGLGPALSLVEAIRSVTASSPTSGG